jgi:hypothetical protein
VTQTIGEFERAIERELQREARKSLGDTLDIRITGNLLKYEFEVWARCASCKLQLGDVQSGAPLLTLSRAVAVDLMPIEWGPSIVEVALRGGDGFLDVERANRNLAADRLEHAQTVAEQQRHLAWITSSLVDKVSAFACACIRRTIKAKGANP